MSSRIDIPIHYKLPKLESIRDDFAEEIYLLDELCRLAGTNLTIQCISYNEWLIEWNGPEYYSEWGESRLDALRNLYKMIYIYKK